ncbi:G_PROTEIN_RECEP_F2_4 domain-containing protein [Meloidogyne graminicola]|uniref:G_PROTEIN_RECEP_F2_4 domain-containing protein n=1 Tax=Meloidogyne graminicola TaxID=189291 RepID=A0A8S9ZRT5_9BILA|nr:G_PROTEIN_RECEP_F2_4 domain-containing protein [Meloidogyne graminicola]
MYNFLQLIFYLILLKNIISTKQQQYNQRTSSIFEQIKELKCQLINNNNNILPSSSLCQNIPYNKTIFPNPFIKIDQTNIQIQLEYFKPLIRTNCSLNILLFICSVLNKCHKQLLLVNLFVKKPSIFNCSNFPSPPAICIKPEFSNKNIISSEKSLSILKIPECPLDLINLEPNKKIGKCAFRCEKTTMFKKDQKEQSRLWFLFWSILNLLISLFTICSFWIDRQRFCFTERSIGFISLCSFFVNLPHLLRQIIGFEKIACNYLNNSNIRYLIIEGINGNIYFHYLQIVGASKKWVEEELNKKSFFLYLFAWGFPILLTIIALNNNLVDASELTGLCSLGNFNQLSLFWFWLFPRILINLIGFFLLLFGYSSIYKEKYKFKNKGINTSKLEKFLLKIGIFSFFYLLFILLNILCDLNHLIIINEWESNTINCKIKGGAFSGNCIRSELPNTKLYIIGQTMGMAFGFSACLFIFSPKTLNTISTNWKKTIILCFCSNNINKSKIKQQKPLLSSNLKNNNKNIITSSSFIALNSEQNINKQTSLIKQYIPFSYLNNSTINIKNNEIYEKHIEKRNKTKNLKEEQSNIEYI